MSDSIITFTGRQFHPLAPRIADIDIIDIAHALSNLCRFTGHSRSFYSVAQHSVIVSDHLPPELQLAGLLHDASEAYLCDISRPVKHSDMMAGYRDAEAYLITCVADKFNVSFNDPRIKDADNRALDTERRDVAPYAGRQPGNPFPERIIPQSPEEAEVNFLVTFEHLTGLPFGTLIFPTSSTLS